MPSYIYVSSGETSSGINIKNNTMYVLSGGTAINTTANAGGNVFVSSDGKAYSTMVNSDGLLTLLSLGFASGTTLNSGGSLVIWNDAMASGVTINPGGSLEIKYAGGSAVQVKENGGCVLDSYDAVSYVPGYFSGLALDTPATVHSGTVAERTILNGGHLAVYSGGIAKQTTVNSGGQFAVFSGGTANDTIVYDYCVAYGGTMTSTTVNSGGSLMINNNGTANMIMVNPGGNLGVYKDCTALEIRENGGYVYLDDGADVTFTPNVVSGAVLNDEATAHFGTTVRETTVNSRLDIYSGGIVSNAVAAGSSAWICVYSGGLADGVTVSAGGIQVFEGGAVDHTTVNAGYLNVAKGAANNTTVNGGNFRVSQGTTANIATVANSGRLILYNSGIVNSATIDSDGSFLILGGGMASSTFVSGGVMNVSSGASANVVKVYGGTVNVLAGGNATGVAASGGTVNVSSGAVLNTATARQDGRIRVYSGGTAVANRATMTGRVLAVNGGALLNCVAISSGFVELEGGSALGTEVAVAGLMLVEGAPHSFGSGVSHGIEGTSGIDAAAYGIASNTRIHLGAVASVGSGGAMIDTVVGYSSASLDPIRPGGKEIDLPSILLQRAGLYINSSGAATGVTASKGAIVAVGAKGILASAKLSSGASAQVLAGGSARTLNVLRGGSATIAGSAADLRIAGAAKAVIGSGGLASTVAVSAGGTLRADAGAKLSDVSVASGGVVTGVFAGLAAQTVTLSDGILDFDISALGADEICVEQLNTAFAGAYSCTLTVGDGQASGVYQLAGDAAGFDKTITVQDTSGEALGTITVDGGKTTVGDYECKLTLSEDNLLSVRIRAAGGVDLTGDLTSEFILTDGMVASSVNVHTSDGRLIVSSGAVATHTTAYEKGTLAVSEGGAADSATVGSGGKFYVSSGGSATNTTVNSNASMTVDSGTVDHTTVNGGNMYLYTQAVANNTTVDNYAWVVVRGATANNTVVKDSYLIIASEGIANSASISSRGALLLQSGGTANNATVDSDGELIVSSGGTAIGTLVFHGQCTVSEGGAAINTLVNSGYVFLQGGATASGTKIYSGGTVYVSEEATAKDTVLSGGKLTVSSGGTANGVTVNSGGSAEVSSGGVANGVTVNSSGSFLIYNGAKFTGRMTFESGAEVIPFVGSILDFDLTQTEAGTAALVNDLSILMGTPSYTLTVDGTEANGVYKLAGGAAQFAGSITVQNASGEALGTLAVGGGTTSIGGVDYTLNLGADDVLSVTVGAVEPGPVGTAKSDIDGNGVSDVMFIWTGNNYAHGYWMNGTSTWQSANSNHPAEWDNLGCYDMTGDGKADSVLFGNVTSEAGIKGAYIGYYADANDLPDGSTWINIGYLTNEDNIQWKNAVGNLTGNTSGTNSIVWYTYELGALGAWTDGTENWVGIGTGFDESWTLIGCGDFDGDGRDQVVMSHNSGAEYHAIDIDGTWTNLGASDSGWEIRVIGDFSGDGRDDIVAFHAETGIVAMWGDGLVSNWSQLGQLDATDWFVVGCGDYNGDAKDDLLVRQYSTGMLGYYASGDMAQWNELGRGVDMDWTVIA